MVQETTTTHDADTGVVPLRQAQAMQHDSVKEDPSSNMTPQPPGQPQSTPTETETATTKKLSVGELFGNTLSTLNVNVMVTLGLADLRFADGTIKSLARWAGVEGGEEYNLYNPFRKGGKAKDSDTVHASGIFRSGLVKAFEAINVINNSSLIFLGKPQEIFPALQSAVGRVADACTQSFHISPDLVLGTLSEGEGEGEGEDATLMFRDIIRVTSWLSMSWFDGREEHAATEPIQNHEAMINFYVNSGALYDSQDKLKMIRQVQSILKITLDKVAQNSTSVLLALNLSTEDLADAEMRDLLGVLIDSEGFEMFTKGAMLSSYGEYDFLPKSKKGIQEDLLNPRTPSGDILLVKDIGAVEEEVEAAQD